MGLGCRTGGTGIGDGGTGAVDTGGKDSGDVGTTSDAGDRGPAMTSLGCKLTGEDIGDSRTLSGGGHEVANTGCSSSAGSGQSDEAGERRGAAAGTCGGQVWTSDRGAVGAWGAWQTGAVGMGGDGNEAGRDMGTWASSYCGYKLRIAALNSCQDSESSNVSRVADHMSHDASSV